MPLSAKTKISSFFRGMVISCLNILQHDSKMDRDEAVNYLKDIIENERNDGLFRDDASVDSLAKTTPCKTKN